MQAGILWARPRDTWGFGHLPSDYKDPEKGSFFLEAYMCLCLASLQNKATSQQTRSGAPLVRIPSSSQSACRQRLRLAIRPVTKTALSVAKPFIVLGWNLLRKTSAEEGRASLVRRGNWLRKPTEDAEQDTARLRIGLHEPKVGFLVLGGSTCRAQEAESKGRRTQLQHLMSATSSSMAAERVAGQAPGSFVMRTSALTTCI